MLSHVVGPALVHQQTSAAWTVTTIEYPDGLAELQRRPRLTQVVIGDRADGSAAPAAECYAAAACTSDGELLVAVRSAPPAIVVAGSGCRTRPSPGEPYDSEFPTTRERMILLSCNAFEAAPDLLAEGVHTAPERLVAVDPEALLLALVGPAGRGAGAVIDPTRPPPPSTGRTHP